MKHFNHTDCLYQPRRRGRVTQKDANTTLCAKEIDDRQTSFTVRPGNPLLLLGQLLAQALLLPAWVTLFWVRRMHMRTGVIPRRRGIDEEQGIDRGVISGLALSAALIGMGMLIGSGRILNFVSLSSALIVFGGTLGATMVNFSPRDLRYGWDAFKSVLFKRPNDAAERIRYLMGLSQAVRAHGRIRALESEANHTQDAFLKLALDMTVDGQQGPEVRRILETEMRIANDRAFRAVQVFETMGSYAPALGLIGTVIGLIQMLGALGDPATVGPAMATALVTTFYGAIAANLVLLPVAGKLRNRAEEEAVVKALTIEGIVGVGNEENPLIIEQRLQSYITK